MRFSLIFAIIMLIGFFGLGYMHEQVHVQIMRGYGIDSHVEYLSHFPDFVTIPDEACPTTDCILAHNINDAIGYPLSIFYCIFGLGLFVLICFKEASFDLEKFKLEIMKAKKEKYGP